MIGDKLRELRKEKKLSQKTIAELLGYHTTTYQRWEEETHSIKLIDIIKIAEFYNISIDYIAGLTDEKRKLK